MNKIIWQKRGWEKFVELHTENQYIVGCILSLRPNEFIAYVEVRDYIDGHQCYADFYQERFDTYLSAIRWANSIIRELQK